jgi:capsular exopolysaccharide synthesis family protein
MRPQIILVTSSGTGDGKTTTSINLAGALALKEDTQVLLLDGDLRRSTIHSKLGIENGPGLREYLGADISLEEAVVDCGEMANLRIMTAGASAANACELLDSPAWVSLCATLRTMYRYIIIDSPPVASVADYDLLQDVADGIVVVMRPDHTKRKSASEALRHIPRSKLLGVVLNCMSGWLLEGSGEEYYYYYAQPQHATSKKH